MTTLSTRPVTRAEKENSKKEFDDLILLIQQEFWGLEGWLLKNANPKLTNLAKLITGSKLYTTQVYTVNSVLTELDLVRQTYTVT